MGCLTECFSNVTAAVRLFFNALLDKLVELVLDSLLWLVKTLPLVRTLTAFLERLFAEDCLHYERIEGGWLNLTRLYEMGCFLQIFYTVFLLLAAAAGLVLAGYLLCLLYRGTNSLYNSSRQQCLCAACLCGFCIKSLPQGQFQPRQTQDQRQGLFVKPFYEL